MFERRVVLTSQAGEASSRAQAGSTALFDKGAPRNYSVLPGPGSFRTPVLPAGVPWVAHELVGCAHSVRLRNGAREGHVCP